jgi:transcriptional regulator with XRE-family HTH domain
MTNETRSPAELRKMFGDNLRLLASDYPSISELCRQLGINRTQFNRYLGGESFPRPDVLNRICSFFDVDARILLRPLNEIDLPSPHPAATALTDFLGSGPGTLTEDLLPAGFYYVSEAALDGAQATRYRVIHARRLPQCTMIRSYEPPTASEATPPELREVQGIAACAGSQVYILMSNRTAQNSKIYLMTRCGADQPDTWRGVAICLSKTTANETTMRRLNLRYLGKQPATAIRAARTARRADALAVSA